MTRKRCGKSGSSDNTKHAKAMSLKKIVLSPQIPLWVLSLFLLSHNCSGFYPYNIPRFRAKVASETRQRHDVVSVQSVIKDNYMEDHTPLISELENPSVITNRRVVMSSLLMTIGLAVGADNNPVDARTPETSLRYEDSPINKRSGITVFQAEKDGYNLRFVTYLSRFLLSFDPECQRWWYARAGDIPRMSTAEEVTNIRERQFAGFSASVEVGLQEYLGPDGPNRLMKALIYRYCPDFETLKRIRDARGQPIKTYQEEKEKREIKEARRQIALLFSLLEVYQPVDEITKLLGALDDASINSVIIEDRGSGYAPGYGPPNVIFPYPEGGAGYRTAKGRAVLRPNGKVLRIDLVNRGSGYLKPPTVKIAPPKDGNDKNCASAKAFVFRDRPYKGQLELIQVVNPGSIYTSNETIRIEISPPDEDGGEQATAIAVLEYEVQSIQIVDGGSGYAAERPIKVFIEPAPVTARVNLNDAISVRMLSSNQLIAMNTMQTSNDRLQTNIGDVFSNSVRVRNEIKALTGGCVGSTCFDKPAIAIAYPRSDSDSYTSFRRDEDIAKVESIEAAVERRSLKSAKNNEKNQDMSPLSDESVSMLPIWNSGSFSSKFLTLLPSGVGLTYNDALGRYELTEADMSNVGLGEGRVTKPIDPEFGPRGRSPIEREKELDLDKLLRFSLSGAICCSSVHIVLTPIDVVKTRIQTDPDKYTDVVTAFKKVSSEQGLGGFMSGWESTFLGFFAFGGVTFVATEYFRRYFTDLLGNESSNFEIFIILAAAAASALLGAVTLAPFEAIRIRTVAQPDYGSNLINVVQRISEEEGFLSLYAAVPVGLFKEIPFAMAKFAVFDLSTAWLYDVFPAAQEDLQLSLLVSLAGGTLGGMTASIVSNPGDAILSELKKTKSYLGPFETAKILIKRGGVAALFRGLGLRMFFYSLIVSLQFFVYDTVRVALGVASDDMKMYLDVLGGALRDSSGSVS